MVGGELTKEEYLSSLKNLVGKKWYSTDDNREIFITIDNSQYGKPWLISITQQGSPPRNDLVVRALPYSMPDVWFRGHAIRSIEKSEKLAQLARDYAGIS
tara:strand:+ start:25 stop:324 length:300 start_codon:yes stop_codon:yes gene_type:complete